MDDAKLSHPLEGQTVPVLGLPGTDGRTHDLGALAGWAVLYAYPRTSPPDAPPIEGWDMIPGARGCTPQSCGFRDHHADLLAAGAARVFGLSTQSTEYQREAAMRLHLPFPLLSDVDLRLTRALGLETFEAGGMILLRRTTFLIRDGRIDTVLARVTDPARNAADVLERLRTRAAPPTGA